MKEVKEWMAWILSLFWRLKGLFLPSRKTSPISPRVAKKFKTADQIKQLSGPTVKNNSDSRSGIFNQKTNAKIDENLDPIKRNISKWFGWISGSNVFLLTEVFLWVHTKMSLSKWKYEVNCSRALNCEKEK